MRVVVDPRMAPLAEPLLICSQYFYDVIRANTEGRPPPPNPLQPMIEELASRIAMLKTDIRAPQSEKAADPEGSAAGEPPCEQF